MNSGWAAETSAVLRKEVLSELRGRHGLYTSLLFAVMAVTAIGFAAARGSPTPALAAGMLWVALLFAAITGLARTFLLEDEQGTGDLLRLWARPGPVFWGKFAYNYGLLILVSCVVLPLHVLFLGVDIVSWPLLAAALLTGGAALASGISVSGALASRAQARGTLAGVISSPILLPVILFGVGAVRAALGDPVAYGWASVAGLTGLAMAFTAVGPYLFAAVWKQ